MYKLLLLDIDGTLKDERLGIPASAKQAIQECRAKGCQVVICTGRGFGTIQDEVLALTIDGYITGGGSYLQYHNQVIWDHSFHHKDIKKIIDLLKKEDVAFAIENQAKVFMNKKAKDILESMNLSKGLHKKVLNQFTQEKIEYKNNLDEYHNHSIHKICLWSNETVFNQIKVILNKDLEIAQSENFQDKTYYEIIPNGFHKGHAVKKLQDITKIKKTETLCFGDGLNDISMFKQANLKIAMKKSHPQLTQIATSVCEDIFEDGIYKELKRRKII